MFKKYLLALFLILPELILSKEVKLVGSIPEYAGETLTFLTYSDQITYKEKELCECMVQENGDFSCSFETEQTIYVFLHLGIYDAFVFVEPGKQYRLLFPEKKQKTMADKLNPYYDPVKYHLGIENSTEHGLNYQLAYFNELYSNMITENSYLIYSKSGKLDVDKEIQTIDSLFSDADNPFFNAYRKYKYASFRHLSYQEKMKSISNTYYLNKEILYKNPAYMELFNQVYKNYFMYFGRTHKGKQIYADINKYKSLDSLKKTLSSDKILTNDTLKELVILKCLHDEFYKDRFSRSAMLIIIDSLKLQTKIPEHKIIAGNIREKVSRLMVGFKPPNFQLYDKDSNLVNLGTYIGEYIYLGFCTTISYGCIKEFEMLQKMYEKHKNHFKIIMICMDDNLEQMKRFVEKKEYGFTFLHYGNQSEVFKHYDVRAFPTYYFINKEGKLALSPAPPPDHNAEFAIFKIMKANGDI